MAEALSRNQEQSGARLLVDGTDGSTDSLEERLQVVRVRILRAWVRNHDQGLLVQIACERLLHQWLISDQSATNQRPISGQSATNQRPISGQSAANQRPISGQSAANQRACERLVQQLDA